MRTFTPPIAASVERARVRVSKSGGASVATRILSWLPVVLAVLVPVAALASDLDNEWDGAWGYNCDFTREGKPAKKIIRADDRYEAEHKFVRWASKNNVRASNVSCQCAGEAGCE